MGIEFLCYDMSEYFEWYIVLCLIGVFLGYVGFDQGGLLTDVVCKYLHVVVVFDEIEKVYFDLFNILF